MLALSLLLTAAAGVNAMVGREVKAVKLSEKSYICADDCTHEGVFFAQKGYFCPENETIIKVQVKGNTEFHFYDCDGTKLETGFSQRQRASGEEPPKCGVSEFEDSDEETFCSSFRSGGGGAGKTVQWSDVEKELKSASSEGGNGTPEENEPAAPKSQEECAQVGRQMFMECLQKSGEFKECDEQGRGAIQNCLGLA
ncbi:hypothetical protein BB8028_0001g16540 [Beauveria bassiana]|uniref:Uncharacterized protein n=1 Tax=Beauveria bassiana TaxID=176275 RepID=A0A2S7Y096_BEABA|nr:hypothetical protein BB8028_0001g16540 [Beauveria bassiana]